MRTLNNFLIILLSVLCVNEALLLRKSLKVSKTNLNYFSKFSQNCKKFSFISQIVINFLKSHKDILIISI